jgi:hypothetical protein
MPANDDFAPGSGQAPEEFGMNDSVSDEERLRQDASYTINLPDVADIPGQEHITSAGPFGEMADTTISSDDEEGVMVDGKDVLADTEEEEDELEIVMGTEADVTPEDLALLGAIDQDMDEGDDEMAGIAGLDDTDAEGEPLNEGAMDMAATGDDLDIPEADGNDPGADAMGQGDEENNYFSLGSDDNDNLTEGTS